MHDIFTLYFIGIVLLFIAFAVKCPYAEIRIVLLLTFFWPASLIVVSIILFLGLFNIEFNIAINKKNMFELRRGTNPKCYGFALTIFYVELQFYKILKK